MTVLQPLVVGLALVLALALAAAIAVRAIVPLVASRSSALWTALALAPFAIAVVALVALLSPDALLRACHCALHGDHHPHLCWMHPSYAAPLVVEALSFLGLVGLLRAPAIARTCASVLRSSWLARAVCRAPSVQIDGIAVHVLDCGEPTAFTAGLWSPRIVVDRTLCQALDAQSLRAVVHHEQAHAERRDGLTLALLRLATAFFPVGLLRIPLERWIAASEAECDRHAATSIGSAADVASALVAVERLRASCPTEQEQLAPAVASADLDRRVRNLLADARRPASLASDALSVAIVVLGLTLLAALWPGDATHHVAETLLGNAL